MPPLFETPVQDFQVAIDSQRSLLHSFLRESDEVRFLELVSVALHSLQKTRRDAASPLEQLDQILGCLFVLAELIRPQRGIATAL